MTRDEAIVEIRHHLGNNQRLLQSTIISAMNRAQQLLEFKPELPWFLKTEISSILTTIDEERVPLPADFLREVEDEALWLYDSSATYKWKKLIKFDPDAMRHEFSETAEPTHYSLNNEYFRLFPTPDAAYTLKTVYYAKGQTYESNVESSWLKHIPDLIIGSAGMFLAAQSFNDRAEAKFKSILDTANALLDVQNEAREHANRTYVMGGED